EAGDARDDQSRVAGEKYVGPEAEAFERAGPEVLDDRVGTVTETKEDIAVAVVLQVERDGALVAVRVLPPQRHVVARIAPAHVAPRVAAWPFDFDYVRSEVGEIPRARGPGEYAGRVDHPQVGEGHTRSIGRIRHRFRGSMAKQRSAIVPPA